MKRDNYRAFKHLLEVSTPATEITCAFAVGKDKRVSSMHLSKLSLKTWRKALAIYLEHDLCGTLKTYTHEANMRKLGVSNQATNTFRRIFDTLSEGQRAALRLAVHRAHTPPPPRVARDPASAFQQLLLASSALADLPVRVVKKRHRNG